MITKEKLQSKLIKGLIASQRIGIKKASEMMTDVLLKFIENEGCLTEKEFDDMAEHEYTRLIDNRNEWEPVTRLTHSRPPLDDLNERRNI